MTFTRRHAQLFLAIAAWNVLTYVTFARNLYEGSQSGEHRPAGYYIAHTVLIVVNFAIAAILGRLGWRALSSTSATKTHA